MPPPLPPSLTTSALSLGLDAFLAATALVHSGRGNARATFECVLTPKGGEGFFVVAGLEALLDALERFRLRPDELEWLLTVGAIDPTMRDRLVDAHFVCDVDAAPEGTVVFPGEPVITVEGPLWQAQLIESWVTSSIDASTRVATFAARAVAAGEGAEIIEAASTRTNRLGGNPLLARAAYVGGAGATTNALAGKRYGIPVRARQPSSFVLSFGSEVAAFESWAKATNEQTLLRIDLHDPFDGVDRAIAAIRARATASWSDAPIALEMGTRDLESVARYASERFAKAGLKPPAIVVSGADLDAVGIAALRDASPSIAGFVIAPTAPDGAGARYELAAIEDEGQWSARVRLGEGTQSSSVPGRKVLLRYFDADGAPVGDVAHLANERHMASRDAKLVDHYTGYTVRLHDAATSSPLLRNMLRGGKRVSLPEQASEARERAQRGVEKLPQRYKRLVLPDTYPCGMTTTLAKLRAELVGQAHAG